MFLRIPGAVIPAGTRRPLVRTLLVAAALLTAGCDDIAYLLDTSQTLCEDPMGFAYCVTGDCYVNAVRQIQVYPDAASCEAAQAAFNGNGGGGGGGGGGSTDCDNYSDNTSYFGDVQLDSLCQAAGYYRACGPAQGAVESCANLDELIDCCWDGGGYCPHC